jgi:DnaK suppressor protein
MAKKVAKKKTAKKVAKKAPAKKAVNKIVVKKAVKKSAERIAKKAASEKAAEKTVVKKTVAKKAVAKKAVAEKTIFKKGGTKVASPTKVPKKVAQKAAKRAVRKKAVEAEDLPPVIVKRRYVRPEKVANLTMFEKKQRQRLLDLRDQISDMMYGIQNDTIKKGSEGSDASGAGMHQGDAGSDAYDRDFALNILSKEANALGEIEEALQRLELGTYGVCEESGAKIPNPRLEAMPFARLTVERQAAKEQENSTRDFSRPNYGFN